MVYTPPSWYSYGVLNQLSYLRGPKLYVFASKLWLNQVCMIGPWKIHGHQGHDGREGWPFPRVQHDSMSFVLFYIPPAVSWAMFLNTNTCSHGGFLKCRYPKPPSASILSRGPIVDDLGFSPFSLKPPYLMWVNYNNSLS